MLKADFDCTFFTQYPTNYQKKEVLKVCKLIELPDTDEKYKGADSILLLKEVCRVLADYNYRIVNIDSTVIAQQPKLKPHIDEMRKNIANACGIDVSLVSVKATTEEKLGFTGRLEGISAHAVCLIEKY